MPGPGFPKGQSGNPGGRPKMDPEVKALLKAQALEAVQKLIDLMRSGNDRVALGAATALLDRYYGKPAQQVSVDGDGEGGPVQFITRIERVIVRPDTANPDG